MIERVKYDVRGIEPQPLIPTCSRTDTTKEALGAQSIEMRDDADHHALQKAGEVWKRHQMEQKQRWPDWTEILGPALVKVQDEAMAVACTNKPEGRRYAQAVSGLLKTYHLDEIDDATRSHAIRIVQNLEVVTDWRAKQEEPERLNHPTTVWRSFALSEEWRGIQVERGIKPKERHVSPKPTKKQLEAVQAELDTTRTDYERVKDENEALRRESEAKNSAAQTTGKRDYDDLRIPDFLDRIDRRGALATLLASEKLTLQDVPARTKPAALAKLANEFSDLAAALKECAKLEKTSTKET